MPDAASVSVRHVDFVRIYDQLAQWYSLFNVAQALANGNWPANSLDELNRFLGIDLRDDLLERLDSTTVFWNALSEGPFLMGQAFAVKVKDAGKVLRALDKLDQALRRFQQERRERQNHTVLRASEECAQRDGQQVGFEKRTYCGVDMYVLTPSPVPITFALHKGWLIVRVLPQAVKGCIRRFEGRGEAWKAPPIVGHVVAVAKKDAPAGSKLAAVTVNDPRPSVEVALALLPTFAALAGTGQVDVSKFPNAHAVNEHLFPGVTIFHDDGNALRWESHFAIWIPDESTVLFPLAIELAKELGITIPCTASSINAGRRCRRAAVHWRCRLPHRSLHRCQRHRAGESSCRACGGEVIRSGQERRCAVEARGVSKRES